MRGRAWQPEQGQEVQPPGTMVGYGWRHSEQRCAVQRCSIAAPPPVVDRGHAPGSGIGALRVLAYLPPRSPARHDVALLARACSACRQGPRSSAHTVVQPRHNGFRQAPWQYVVRVMPQAVNVDAPNGARKKNRAGRTSYVQNRAGLNGRKEPPPLVGGR